MAKPTALDTVADLRAARRDVAEVATDGFRVIAGATDPGATYQTRLEYRDNPNGAWTVLDSWADVAASSASAAIMTALKLEQDLGGLKTADVQELTRAVILSAARAPPPGAFVDTVGTEPRTAKFDTTEYGHTQARSADEALIECLCRVVREIYDVDPDAGGEAARNFVQHTPNPDQVVYPFDGYSDAFLLQAIAVVARDAATPSKASTASGHDVTRQWERRVSQIAPPAVADPAWADLAATRSRAAASGWDLPGGLQRLVSENPLPDRHPALELQCRAMAECEASMPASPSVAEINGTSADRARGQGPAPPPSHRAQQATSTNRDAPGR